MNEAQLITEEQARKLAGVSSKTLLRFAEAGYLKIETRGGSERYFQFRELRDLFGLHDTGIAPQPVVTATAAIETEPVRPAQQETPAEDTLADEPPVLQEIRFSRADATKTQKLQRELRRLRALNGLQERLLDERDAEIADLKEQRTWLRERVEKLEDKADRDQLLLLSETRMVSHLLQQANKKSALRLMLEWTGIVPPEPENKAQVQRPTIEVQSK